MSLKYLAILYELLFTEVNRGFPRRRKSVGQYAY
jgi:hypothetical protein